MKSSDSIQAEHIYDLVCGNLELNGNDIPFSDLVKSEFEEGSSCAAAYDRMLEAYSRVCQRLGSREWEDTDVEIIIQSLMAIGKHTSLKMFDYGMLLGQKAYPSEDTLS